MSRAAAYALRLSVTDACNFRCRYCRPADRAAAPEHLPPPERLERVAAWVARNLGATRVRLTGGEPLLREDITAIVERLARIDELEEVSLTTNGSRLAPLAAPLARAGLRRVNVSLDSVDPERFGRITGGGRLERAVAGIEAALEAGLRPLKLNAVLAEPWWREDLPALLSCAADWNVELRLIELMPVGPFRERAGAMRGSGRCGLVPPRWAGGTDAFGPVRADAVRAWLGERAPMEPLRGAAGAAARKGRVLWDGAWVEVGWITPVSEPFCGGCDRLRVDAAGNLHRCLMDPCTWPLAERIETGADDDPELAAQARRYLAGKVHPQAMRTPCGMDRMGG